MVIFEPLAFLAALFAIATAFSWWDVAKATQSNGSDAARVNRKLFLAAVGTMLTLALAAASMIVLPIAGLFI